MATLKMTVKVKKLSLWASRSVPGSFRLNEERVHDALTMSQSETGCLRYVTLVIKPALAFELFYLCKGRC